MYSFEQLMTPIWNTDIIYEESLTMVEYDGVAQAPLLFRPAEVLSVTSADKTAEYVQGEDWIIEDAVFRLTPQSRIFRFGEDEVLFDKEIKGKCFPTKDGRYSLFSEGHFFHDRQISITYKKAEGELKIRPAFCKNALPGSIGRLENGEPLKIVLFGDSISAGANSSGLTLTTPFLPTWGNLLAENLRRAYGTGVGLINTAVGGKDSFWGIEQAKAAVGNYKPDLVIIAFGMNDRICGEEFAENIRKIREIVTEASPHTEFILCATTLPNKELRDFYKYQDAYAEALETLREPGTVIADFGAMQKALLERKRFIDLTGNNVNHPNDFMIRCHAQFLSGMLIHGERGEKR